MEAPLNRTRTDSGMSRGMKPRAPAKATSPDPAGKLKPIGKRVWESPPVPIVSGRSRRLSQEWMMPSPGRRETPLRSMMNAGKEFVHLDVGRLGIGRGVTERLHEQVGLEFQASQLLELVGGHRAGRVLGADGGHLRLAGRAGQDALGPAGPPDDLLGVGVTLARFGTGFRDRDEESASPIPRARRALFGQGPADDQVQPPAGAEFVPQGRAV